MASTTHLEHDLGELWTVSEAALVLRTSAGTVRRLCKSGELPHILVGTQYRVLADQLLRPVSLSARGANPTTGRLR